MYVCICNAITLSEVRGVIESGARSVEAVTAACRAGGGCGSCIARIERLLDESATASTPAQRRLPLVSDGRISGGLAFGAPVDDDRADAQAGSTERAA
jgi:bacterioferritin-associated ferredoxin